MTAVAPADAARRVITTTPANQHFKRMAYVCAAVGVIGFAPTYWIPLVSGRLTLDPILHLHAVVFYAWLTLFVIQAHLAASRQIQRHREVGVFGVAIATAMCFVGVAAAINSLRQGQAAGFGDEALGFSVVPLTGIMLFAVMFAYALLNVRRPDVHKRILLIATVGLLNAAVGRLFILALGAPPPTAAVAPPPVFFTVPAGLITDLLLIPAMLHDRKHLGRVHRVYWIWGGVLVASQLLRAPIAATDAWGAIASGIAALVP
jgi:hypothetical protein